MKTIKMPSPELRVEAVKDLQRKGWEPSPENLGRRSMQKSAPLYDHFSVLSEKDFADYGRYEHCRKIIRSVPQYEFIGGKKIEHRMVECVTIDKEKRWAFMDDILADPDMTDAYYEAVQTLLRQAQDKLSMLQQLQRARSHGDAA